MRGRIWDPRPQPVTTAWSAMWLLSPAFPRVSVRDGRDQVQRGENYELGVSRKEGSRVYRVAGYRESVKNAALTISGSGDAFGADVLSDPFSNTGVFNAGDYHTIGYTASVTQNLADDRYKLTVMYGSVGSAGSRFHGTRSG